MQPLWVQKHFLPLQKESEVLFLPSQRRIETAPPSNCPKMQGVAFTGVELVIWTIEGSVLMWKITHAAKGTGECANMEGKKGRNCSCRANKVKGKICHLAGDLLQAVVCSESCKCLCCSFNSAGFRGHSALKNDNNFIVCALMERGGINLTGLGMSL